MRFAQSQMRIVHKPPSKRRLTAARKRLKKEADACGLFPWMAPTETPEERVARQDALHHEHICRMRRHVASVWKKSRAQLYAMPKDQRQALIAEWDKSGLPPSAEYFADFIWRKVKEGVKS